MLPSAIAFQPSRNAPFGERMGTSPPQQQQLEHEPESAEHQENDSQYGN
jgi:hypothetical protein